MFKVKAPVLAGHCIVIVALAALHGILSKTMFADFIRILLCCISFFAILKKKENVRIRYSCMYVYTICFLQCEYENLEARNFKLYPLTTFNFCNINNIKRRQKKIYKASKYMKTYRENWKCCSTTCGVLLCAFLKLLMQKQSCQS